MWLTILSFLSSLLEPLIGVFKKIYSKENVLRETGAREAEIQDEAEEAARLASSDNEKEKQKGIDKMRDLISE